MSNNIGLQLLMTRVGNLAKMKGLKNVTVAERLGISTGAVSQIYSAAITINFIQYVKILNMLLNNYDEKIKYIKEFVKVNERPENNRLALEWCSNNGEIKIQEYLIKQEKSKDPDKGLAYIYDCLRLRNKKKLVREKLYCKVNEYKCKKKFKEVEASALAEMATIYSFLDMNGHYVICHLLDSVRRKIDLIPDKKKYLKRSFMIRLLEIKAISLMRNNQIKNAKEIIDEIMTLCSEEDYPIVYNSLYSLLAELNMTRNYEKSLFYIKKAISLFDNGRYSDYEKRLEELKATHDFIKIFNKDLEGLYLETLPEQAFYLVSIGDEESIKKSLEIFEQLEEKGLSSFQKYFKGKALKDVNLATESIEELRCKGNQFYAAALTADLEFITHTKL